MSDQQQRFEERGDYETATVGVDTRGFVTLYACDNYGQDPNRITPSEARRIAVDLLVAADHSEVHHG